MDTLVVKNGRGLFVFIAIAIFLLLSNTALAADVVVTSTDIRTNFLSLITNPTVAYLLLLFGFYGIFFELTNPGIVAPGVVGLIALLLALYAMHFLPINYAGLGLLFLGLVFIVAEVITPTYGALGLGGTAAFIIGSIFLIDSPATGAHVAWSAISAMTVVNIIFLGILLNMALKSKHKPVQHGAELLIGARGRSLGPINLEGQALIHGEIWSVHAQHTIVANKPIKVLKVDGLILEVEEIQGE